MNNNYDNFFPLTVMKLERGNKSISVVIAVAVAVAVAVAAAAAAARLEVERNETWVDEDWGVADEPAKKLENFKSAVLFNKQGQDWS